MKFRVSSKDLAMLVFMAVLLFLGAGLITSNLSTLLNEGVFTVNPFIGWVNHTGLTVIVFIGIIVLIFTSVSSSVIDRKKGIGFEIGEKNDKGY